MYVVMLGEKRMMMMVMVERERVTVMVMVERVMVMVERVMVMVMTRRDEGRRMMRRGDVLGIAIAIV